MADTIGIGIDHRYFDLRYQVSVTVLMDQMRRYNYRYRWGSSTITTISIGIAEAQVPVLV